MPIPEGSGASPDGGVVFELVEALATIQQHTPVQLRVPDLTALERRDADRILEAADLLRGADGSQ